MAILSSDHSEQLTRLVARQRRELERLRAEAAARTVTDLARGILMERLGCSAAEARSQLATIAAEAGADVIDLAVQIVGDGGWQPPPARPGSGNGGDPGQAPADADVRAAGAAEPLPAAAGGEGTPNRAPLAAAAIELAADAPGIAAAILEEALTSLGAVAVAIWLIAPDGALDLAGQAGFGAREASRWRRIPPGIGSLAERAARHPDGVWLPRGAAGAGRVPLIGRWTGGARAVVPIRTAGSVLGSLEVCWPGPLAEFDLPTQRQITALADLCGQALGAMPAGGEQAAADPAQPILGLLEGLHDSVIFARALRGDDGAVTDFLITNVSPGFRDPAGRRAGALADQTLLEAFPAAALPGSLYDLALDVLASGEPRQVSGDFGALPVGTMTGAPATVRIARLFDGVVMTWRHAAETERLTTLLQHAQRLGRIGSWEENLITGAVHWTEPTFAVFGREPGKPIRLGEIAAHVPADDAAVVDSFRSTLLREASATAAVFRIIREDDGSIRQIRAFAEPVTDQAGTLVAVRGAYQDVSSQYHMQVALAATREQLSDTQDRALEEHRLATRLQEAITPQSSHLVAAAGLDVAARYRPAGQVHLVSGDWYDAVLLPSKEVMLVVGDVAGHGIDAVTGMVALRNCLRGLAITGAEPAELLGWLNNAAYYLTDGILGTAICGIYDPATRTLRWARAGHIPPVLVRAGQARTLRQPSGLLLGAAADAVYQQATTTLRLDDTLLLFTDGLIERRDQSIDDSLRTLLDNASRPVRDLDEYTDLVMAGATSDTGDDACLLAVTLR